jgi:cob(I)alamin adenosyltransferase
MNDEEIQQSKNEIKLALEKIKDEINSYDLVIFDELLNAQSINFINEFDIIKIIEEKKDSQELAFTGRKTSDNLKIHADYISNINPEKHPYEKGIPARIGIEF